MHWLRPKVAHPCHNLIWHGLLSLPLRRHRVVEMNEYETPGPTANEARPMDLVRVVAGSRDSPLRALEARQEGMRRLLQRLDQQRENMLRTAEAAAAEWLRRVRRLLPDHNEPTIPWTRIQYELCKRAHLQPSECMNLPIDEFWEWVELAAMDEDRRLRPALAAACVGADSIGDDLPASMSSLPGPTAARPSYGEILKSFASQMPKGRPRDPDPVEPTAAALRIYADQLTGLDRTYSVQPVWYASKEVLLNWVLAYGRWIDLHRPALLSDAPTLRALLAACTCEDLLALARELRAIAARWTASEPATIAVPAKQAEPTAAGPVSSGGSAATPPMPKRSPAMSLERLATAFNVDTRTLKNLARDWKWDLRREGSQRWTVSYAHMGPDDIARIERACRSKTTRRSKLK